MSDQIGTYTFLPWVRQGMANQLKPQATGMRASLTVAVSLDGAGKDGATHSVPISRDVNLYGPGDLVGVDRAQISRLEPHDWVTNFEPNYFAAIEFYDEDFPWRYTPAQPAGRRLLPWLSLVVLEEGAEFKEGAGVTRRPLPYVEVTADFATVFAPAGEAWAWAHAHFNAELSPSVVETNADTASQAAQNVMENAPDTACSRLLCPRKLKPGTAYHAFLMPAFESGRLAGLGQDPKPLFDDAANSLIPTSPSTAGYGARPEPTYFPYYFRWYFRTADQGDFESLVRLLQPRVVDARVGHRDMDVTDPAPNVTGITDPALGGVLRLGGALRAPLADLDATQLADYNKYDQWATPYPTGFQQQLASFVDLADSYQQSGPQANQDGRLHQDVQDDPDPLVVPPIYGRWHALTERLLWKRDGTDAPNRENWVHDLNLDPRWRTAAGFGTVVVQQNQEDLMKGAWDQIGQVLEANRRIRQAQLAKAAGRRLFTAHFAPMASSSPSALLLLASPMKARLLSQGVTVRKQIAQSPMGLALASGTMRRILRPRARVAKQLGIAADGPQSRAQLVIAANSGQISAAPPRAVPARLLTSDALAEAAVPKGPLDAQWAELGSWIPDNFALALLLLLALVVVILAVLGFSAVGMLVAMVAAGAAIAVGFHAQGVAARRAAAQGLSETAMTPAAVANLPGSSSFALQAEIDPRTAPAPAAVPAGEQDNAEALRFKAALRDQFRMIDASRSVSAVAAPVPADLPRVAADAIAGMRPEMTVPRWTLSGLTIPPRILTQMGGGFSEVMAYPEFDMPMYEPLVKAGTELFVPNLKLVEQNSVTLLETNERFIESYMVGLNHEFARELLWREYVTDQRGSYFRQFWDVRKLLATAPNPAAREALKDIKPIDQWPIDSNLGDNDNREPGANPRPQLVLVIRGELLKKYPNAIISAQPAKWQLTGGKPDHAKERVLDDSVMPTAPLYEARVAPDLFFFGFPLTAEEARGDDSVDDKPGWFFRIEEVPGDARFGFDLSRDGDLNVWNDLSWPDVAPGLDAGPVSIGAIPPLALTEPTGPEGVEKHAQWEQDKFVPVDANLSAAELAYVSFQAPVLVAIHASEMLNG